MKVNVLVYVTLSLSSWSIHSSGSYGQAKAPQGTIQEAEFIIKKERKNPVPEANRLVKKAPLPLSTEQQVAKLEYELYDIPLDFQPLDHKIKILRAKQERIINLYSKYLKLGYGNYHMPYIGAFFDNTRNKKYAYGLHFTHLSEGKNKYAEEHHDAVSLHGKKLTEELTLSSSLDYTCDKYPFKQVINNAIHIHNDPNKYFKYHQVQLQASLYNHAPGPFNYQIHTQFTYLNSSSSNYEHQQRCKLHVDYKLNDIFQLQADLGCYLRQYKSAKHTIVQGHVSNFKPLFVTHYNDFTIQTGTTLAYQNDTAALAQAFHAYPEVKIMYAFNKIFRSYIGLSGNIQANSWQENILQNPWLTPSVDLKTTDQKYIWYTGIQSDILNMLTCHAGLSISSYENWPCFVNNTDNPRQFDIRYNTRATVAHIFTEFAKSSFAEALVTRLKTSYFNYTLTNLEKAWHKPRYAIEVLNTYNFHDKILLKNNIHWLGGIQALDPTTKAIRLLPDAIAIDLGIEYLWNQRFSIFIDCQNILAKDNNRYLHAPTSGFHCLAGITYAW
jgi:hypothetical protein